LPLIGVRAFDDGGGVVTGNPRCARTLPISNVTTIVDVPMEPAPIECSLGPVLPNPFTSDVTVPYQLSMHGRVEIAVYNALGVRVAILQRGDRAAGQYRIAWDGKDEQGRTLSAGLYYLRLIAVDSRGRSSETVRGILKQ
jgi:hypothetical protein